MHTPENGLVAPHIEHQEANAGDEAGQPEEEYWDDSVFGMGGFEQVVDVDNGAEQVDEPKNDAKEEVSGKRYFIPKGHCTGSLSVLWFDGKGCFS